jgi:hypothetical protein
LLINFAPSAARLQQIEVSHFHASLFVQKSMQLHQRKLYALRKRLQRYPQAVTAILQTAGSLNRPVDTLQPQDVRSLG